MPVAMPTAHRDALHDLVARLRVRFGERLSTLRLFGSWARGSAHADSDLDVAAVVDGLTEGEWRLAIRDAADVELAHDVVLGPYVVSAAHFADLIARGRSLARNIRDQGIDL